MRLVLGCVLAGLGLSLAPAWVPADEGATPPVRLTQDGRRKEDLAWSPDGRLLACSYYHTPGRIGIGIWSGMGDWKVLTTNPVSRAPAWSADGTRLAFTHVTQSGTDGELDIHAMDAADGGRRAVLVDGKAFDNAAAFSPDGRWLAFTTTRDKTQEIYVAEADGKNRTRITQDSAIKQYPRWLPDSRHLIFNANPDGNFDLYRMARDGSGLTRLTDHPAADTAPAVSPQGDRIAFVSLRDENLEVYVMPVAGGTAVNVSRHAGYDFSPAWRDAETLTWVSDRAGRYDVFSLHLPSATKNGAP